MEITSGQLLTPLVIATPFAFLVSIGLLSLYRRAVLRSMRTRASSAPITESMLVVDSTLQDQPPLTPVRIVVLDKEAPHEPGQFEKNLFVDLRLAPRRAAMIYSLAGLCCAAVLSASFFLSTGIGFLPFRFTAFLWLYAWPIVLSINLVAGTTWQQKLLPVAAYFLALIGLETIAVMTSPDGFFGQLTLLWIVLDLPVIVLLQFFLSSKVRAVGPLVLIIMIFAVTGAYIAYLFATSDAKILASVVEAGLVLRLVANGIFIAALLLGFVAMAVCGWLIIQWVANRYKRKKISDQSITLDAIWFFHAVFVSVDFMEGGMGWLLAGPLAFVVYKVVSLAGFSFQRHQKPPTQNGNTLLLLRVFSLGKRSASLFDAISTHWRYIGDIRLIAGPDLVTTTVEPHEFLDFISGKLARRFIDNSELFNLRLAEMDLNLDPDGRFRINDFFCRDDTWRMVLARLITECDVVLMDLRGFSSQNDGCIFEINELINIVPLRRVVFVIDDTTDEAFLRQIIQQSWSQMRPASPNRVSNSESLRLFRLTSLRSNKFLELLQTLSAATGPPL